MLCITCTKCALWSYLPTHHICPLPYASHACFVCYVPFLVGWQTHSIPNNNSLIDPHCQPIAKGCTVLRSAMHPKERQISALLYASNKAKSPSFNRKVYIVTCHTVNKLYVSWNQGDLHCWINTQLLQEFFENIKEIINFVGKKVLSIDETFYCLMCFTNTMKVTKDVTVYYQI